MGYWTSNADARGAETREDEGRGWLEECFFDDFFFLLLDDDDEAERDDPADEEDSAPLLSPSEEAAVDMRCLRCFFLDDEAAEDADATDSSADDAPPSLLRLRLCSRSRLDDEEELLLRSLCDFAMLG